MGRTHVSAAHRQARVFKQGQISTIMSEEVHRAPYAIYSESDKREREIITPKY